MKQPIAVNFELIEDVVCNCQKADTNELDTQALLKLFKIADTLKKYHNLYISAQKWEESFNNLKKQIRHPELLKFFKDLFDFDRGQKYKLININIENEIELNHILAKETPDKLFLNNNILQNFTDVNYYDANRFIKDQQYAPDCVLYRLEKIVSVPAKHIFNNLTFLSPYLRESYKIEFCDRYLFKDQNNDECNFLFDITRIAAKSKDITIYCDNYNELSIYRNEFANLFGEKFPHKNLTVKPYNYKLNKCRYIIIDGDSYSIEMAVSFNNFISLGEGRYKINKGFDFIYTRGRKYDN
jgi:hypothetical protein